LIFSTRVGSFFRTHFFASSDAIAAIVRIVFVFAVEYTFAECV